MRASAQVILAVFLPLVHAFLLPSTMRHTKAPAMKWQEAASSSYYYCNMLLLTRSGGEPPALFFSSKNANRADANENVDKHNTNHADDPEKDTIRVRIWRALAFGDELSMTQLSKQVGVRRGDLRSHLTHVERQAKTIGNKKNEWRVRRGLSSLAELGDGGSVGGGPKKLRLKMRKGAKNEVFIRLV
mmetsp:Transcript_8397/g.15261  ORF Transcript_8397/g.15261 Transcript_8397/m.15261 type:complete len:187 (-) Transcript_8397:442-1002(-)